MWLGIRAWQMWTTAVLMSCPRYLCSVMMFNMKHHSWCLKENEMGQVFFVCLFPCAQSTLPSPIINLLWSWTVPGYLNNTVHSHNCTRPTRWPVPWAVLDNPRGPLRHWNPQTGEVQSPRTSRCCYTKSRLQNTCLCLQGWGWVCFTLDFFLKHIPLLCTNVFLLYVWEWVRVEDKYLIIS